MDKRILFWLIGTGTGLIGFCLLALPVHPFYQKFIDLWANMFASPLSFLGTAVVFVVSSMISQKVLMSLIKGTSKRAPIVATGCYIGMTGGFIGTLIFLLLPFTKEQVNYAEEFHPVSVMLSISFAVCLGFPLGVVYAIVGALVTVPVGWFGVSFMRKALGVASEPQVQSEQVTPKVAAKNDAKA